MEVHILATHSALSICLLLNSIPRDAESEGDRKSSSLCERGCIELQRKLNKTS